jgi:uncharacterized ParB-like nuclease family protein
MSLMTHTRRCRAELLHGGRPYTATLKAESGVSVRLTLLTKSENSRLTRNSCLLLNLHRAGPHFWRGGRCDHYGVEAVLKPEKFPIEKIYVPVKRRKTLKSEVVQEIAESILEIGQQAPILVRLDEDRFILVEGLHRLEACKALGEKTIIGLLVSAQVARQEAPLPHNDQEEAERQKMARLRKLRLEKEAAEKLAVASRAVMETESAVLPRERPEKYIRNNLKVTPSRRRTSESTPSTLSEWLTKQERDGGRY